MLTPRTTVRPPYDLVSSCVRSVEDIAWEVIERRLPAAHRDEGAAHGLLCVSVRLCSLPSTMILSAALKKVNVRPVVSRHELAPCDFAVIVTGAVAVPDIT